MSFILLIILILGAMNLNALYQRGPEEGDYFEGDIMLTPSQKRMIQPGSKTKRGAIIGYRWPNGVVPYKIDNSLPSNAKTVILRAMQEWSNKTCIKFRLRTTEVGYILFYKPVQNTCSSYVGYQGSPQKINLGQGCWHHGIVVHEIGHALGFYHEQSRPDRDSYVKILWFNIRLRYWYNFYKYSSRINSLGEPYDYGSIMHYGKKAFSRNGRDTIKTLNGAAIGQRVGLSSGDAKQMNLMYNCINTTTPTSNCSSGWLSYNNFCYYFSPVFSSSLSWSSARASCQNMGAKLLCVQNINEWSFIQTTLSQPNLSGMSYWIGPNDISKEGSWVCSGQSLTYTKWYTNQPNNWLMNQDCAVVLPTWYNNLWNDQFCWRHYGYICKK